MDQKQKLTPITLSDFIAEKGKFRSVIIIDSEPYQINEDQASLEEARTLCEIALNEGFGLISVFNDKGENIPFGRQE